MRGFPANRDFFLHAINWLASYEDRIAIPAKSDEVKTVRLTTRSSLLVKMLVVIGLPIIPIVIGWVVWHLRRR